jgi:uncharacterized protein (DUF58 family)
MMPTRRLLALCAAWTAAGLLAALYPPVTPAVAASGGLLLLAAVIDAMRAWRTPPPRIVRETAAALPLASWRPVRLRLESTARRPVAVRLFDHHPEPAESRGLPAALILPAGGQADVHYEIRFNDRGRFAFAGVDPSGGPWGLFAATRLLPPAAEVRVYPDFAAVIHYALLATSHRLSQVGAQRRRRRGEGTEFLQLREYRRGDLTRQIDWKASSRLRKLVSREYEDARDQQVLFLLDCGSRMRARDGRLSHFDEALNALLLLAHVAVRQGDSVGVLTFAGSDRLLPPAKGVATLGRLMEGLYDLQPGLEAPDYRAAATRLTRLTSKRSLVVLLTNLRDDDGSELLEAVQLLRRRHMVLVASLRESAVDALVDPPEHTLEAQTTAALARMYLDARARQLAALDLRGAQVLDVVPARLHMALVNRYLDVKLAGSL